MRADGDHISAQTHDALMHFDICGPKRSKCMSASCAFCSRDPACASCRAANRKAKLDLGKSKDDVW